MASSWALVRQLEDDGSMGGLLRYTTNSEKRRIHICYGRANYVCVWSAGCCQPPPLPIGSCKQQQKILKKCGAGAGAHSIGERQSSVRQAGRTWLGCLLLGVEFMAVEEINGKWVEAADQRAPKARSKLKRDDLKKINWFFSLARRYSFLITDFMQLMKQRSGQEVDAVGLGKESVERNTLKL